MAVIQVRISDDLEQKLEQAVTRTTLAKADFLRQAIEDECERVLVQRIEPEPVTPKVTLELVHQVASEAVNQASANQAILRALAAEVGIKLD